MKRLLWVVSFFALVTPLAAQNEIPNAGMESWDSTLTMMPHGWQTVMGASRVAGHSGLYACQLVNSPSNGNPGVVIYGNTNNGQQFFGGIPFTERPDSITAYFKYHIVLGDTAFFGVLLKKQGQFICSQWLPIAANGAVSSSFTQVTRGITYIDTNSADLPDSLIVGVICTNPHNQVNNMVWPAGDTLIVDDISFPGARETIPNGNFETWDSAFSYSPVGWYGSSGGPSDTVFSIKRTTSAFAGAYAALLQSFVGDGDSMSGYAGTIPPQDTMTTTPSFKVSQRYTTFSFAYKYLPQNGDSMVANAIFFKNHSQIGGCSYFSGAADSVWTQVNIPITYPSDSTGVAVPDSATISLSASNNYPKGNSMLYIDNLAFSNPSAIRLNPVVPLSGSDKFTAKLNAQSRRLSITFQLTTADHVTIRLMDMTGREINELLNRAASKGAYTITFDVSYLGEGIYLVQKKTGNSLETKKIVATATR